MEHDNWKKEEDLENMKKLVTKFEERINTEVRRQEKLNIAEEKDFTRGQLPEKYIVKMLYGQDNEKFENKYLKRLEKNWKRQKGKDKTI